MSDQTGTGWENWVSLDWAKKLFLYYFCSSEEEPEEVASLSVSSEDLKILVGDKNSSVDSVERLVSKCVRGMIEQGNKNSAGFMNLLKRDKTRVSFGIPQIILPLYLTCLAASAVLEDDEAAVESATSLKDFREIVAKLLRVDVVIIDSSLPECWDFLQAHLEKNSTVEVDGKKFYTRKLVLPKVGHETHIGYSKKLVFPCRRDQERLADVLRSEDLVEDNPPVDSVISAVTKRKNSFSNLFKSSFDEFKLARQNGETFLNLSRYGFWNVVMRTCANQLLTSDIDTSTISLLVEPVDGGNNNFWLVGSKASGQLPDKFLSELIQDVDGWHQRISLKDDDQDPVSSVLQEPTGLGRLTGLIRGGFIPFVLRPDRYLDVATPVSLVNADSALVRSECLEVVRDKFGPVGDSAIRKTQFEGWVFVRNLKMRALAKEDIDGTTLSQASVLLKRIVRPQLRILSLFNIGSEFLGWKELLPEIDAPEADDVSLTVDQTKVELIKTGGRWTIKPDNYLGNAVVEAWYGVTLIRKLFEFVDVPTASNYKSPTSPDAWMIEVNQGTDVYSRYLSLRSVNSVQRIGNSVHRVYLGEVPGQFLDKPDNAVVQISYFGEEVKTLILDKAKLIESNCKVNDKGLVRRWRKEIRKIAVAPPADLTDNTIFSKMASKTVFEAECRPVGGFKNPPTPYEDTAAGSSNRDVIISALATRLLRANGIPIRQWREMLKVCYKIEWKKVRYVHRGWLEAGIIDELSSTRSPGLRIYARQPRIEVFATEEAYIGAITGLVMPKQLESLRRLAAKRLISTAINLGPSPLIPPHLRLRADSVEVLLDFAKESRLEVFYLQEVPFPDETSRENGEHPSNGYRPRDSFPTFTPPHGVELKAFESNRDPMIWAVLSSDLSAWSYSSSHAEFLACHIAAENNLRRITSVDIAVDRAFIPLKAARWIVSISGVPTGPDEKLQHIYRFPSPESADKFFDYYQRNVVDTLARWRNSGKEDQNNA